MTRRHVIIGSGIAGLTAAETLRERDPGAEVTLVGAEAHPFYSRPGLAYLLAGALPERQLELRTKAELRALALDRLVDEVTALEPEAHRVRLRTRGVLAYDRLLLATGSAAVAPDFPGATLDGVVKLDGLDDARDILRRARRARTAVVVGGGATAVELAEGLAARGVRVHYLMRGARYWASVLEPAESALVEEGLAAEGIELHRHERVVGVDEERGRVRAVRTSSGAVVPCELVAVAIGVRPRVELARAAGLSVERGIAVDAGLRTSAPDVFAAGDAAELRDPDGGAGRCDVLWSSAVAHGRVAAGAMLGEAAALDLRPRQNVMRLGGVTTTVVGAVGAGDGAADDPDLVAIARGDSERWRDRPRGQAFHDRGARFRIRAHVGERTVVGAVVLGDARAARALAHLVRAGTDVSALGAGLSADPEHAVAALVALGEAAEQREASGAARA
ncbi:MAG: FAD-dependent oxidoreductase [Polyangiaceae bacterium]|nr:FAD-dependent oxidoreductase [Polyangiaceae bacterium]